ncbi:MAG: fructose-bisphosphatase class III [Ruminococcaceae bacterium]|nr:fructose-bisphosphatase class III [Oscillospiraceae bacterium]
MRYITADPHGCYDAWCALLEKIRLTERDTLYVLGDVVDRGPEPIRLLQDMMARPNVVPILGNHDFAFYYLMRQLAREVTAENWDTVLSTDLLEQYAGWQADGGEITARQFRQLSDWDREDILDYLAEASAYEVLQQGSECYILVHAGLQNFAEQKPLEAYELADFLGGHADYSRRYFSDPHIHLVTGHTPTLSIHGKAQVYMEKGHIALDCGCVFGGKLAAFCLETGQVTYVEGLQA